jgi:hypothetical protein
MSPSRALERPTLPVLGTLLLDLTAGMERGLSVPKDIMVLRYDEEVIRDARSR